MIESAPDFENIEGSNLHDNEGGHEQPTVNEKSKRRCIVGFYFIALALLHADYNLLAPNLSQIAQEFGMDENERDVKLGGQVALSFFMFGVPSSFLVGWLTDSMHRRAPIFAIVILIGEVACFMTYFTKSFAALLITRSITGIGIGGSLPVVYSVLGDLYEAEGRNAISGVIATAIGLGLGIGQALAGYLGPKFGWRLPFLIVSIPSFFVGFASFFLPEPHRGSKERAVMEFHKHHDSLILTNHNNENSRDLNEQRINQISLAQRTEIVEQTSSTLYVREVTCAQNQIADVYNAERPNIRSTFEMLKSPTVILILLQGAPNVIPFGIASTFLNDYLSQEKGLSVEEATSILLTFGAGNAIGVIVGSLLGHISYKKDKRIPAILMGLSTILTCIPMYFVINMDFRRDGRNIAFASAMTFFAGFLSIFPIPIERAILTNCVLPETRGRANSLLNVIDDLGKGFGPFLLSTMIASLGRAIAFNYSLIGWLLGGGICMFMFFTIERDEREVQDQIRIKLEQQREGR